MWGSLQDNSSTHALDVYKSSARKLDRNRIELLLSKLLTERSHDKHPNKRASKSASDVSYILQHEIDLAVEEQDGALDDPIDVSRVARALKRVKAAQQDSTNMEAK